MPSEQSSNYAQDAIDRLSRHAPGEDLDLTRLYALLVLVKGTEATLKDVHDAWSLWRNENHPTHPSIVPFDHLTEQVQELDRPYRDAIARAAAEIGAGDG